jgi:hypothetical protein
MKSDEVRTTFVSVKICPYTSAMHCTGSAMHCTGSAMHENSTFDLTIVDDHLNSKTNWDVKISLRRSLILGL